MKKRKLSLVMLIIAAVTCTTLSGCQSGKIASDDNSGIMTVTVWSKDTHSKKVFEAYINEYNLGQGKKDGIKIDYIVKEGENIDQSVDLALQSGDAPDIFYTSAAIKKLIENNYIANLQDLPGGPEFLKKYENDFIEGAHKVDGKIYTVPNSSTTQGLVYNKDMFKAAGIVDEKGEAKPPETLDELREYAKKLTNPAKNEYGIIMPVKWEPWFRDDVMALLHPTVGHNGYNPVTRKFEFEGVEPIFDSIMGMFDDGSVYPGASSLENDQARAQFAYGGIGMKFAYSYDVGVYTQQFPAQIDWGVAPLPIIDKNERYLQRMFVGSTSFLSQKSLETKDKEKLMTVIKLFTSDDIIQKCYLEGVALPYDWNIVKDLKSDNLPKGWAGFAALSAISCPSNTFPQIEMAGKRTIDERFLTDVMSKKATAADAIKEFTADAIAGMEEFYKNNTSEDINLNYDDKWDTKRKD